MNKTYETIDAYIADAPQEVQEILENIRSLILDLVPEGAQKIAYGMPTIYYHTNMIHFAAFKKHIGIYPTPKPIEAFQKKLVGYKQGKGSIQFPLNQEIPYDLIKELVWYRLEEINEKYGLSV